MSSQPSTAESTQETIRECLASEIERLFAAAENENFEDGFNSVLSLELLRLVLQYGDAALEIVSDLILQQRSTPEVAAEALRCLGQVPSDATHEARRQLLERSLTSVSHVTRDGALIGLSNLRDPRAIPALETAAAREDYRLLRANMLEVLGRLKGLTP